MIEKAIHDAIEHLFTGGAHYDVAPAGTKPPYLTLQQVGGEAANDLDGADSLENARIQIDVFGSNRTEANCLMSQVKAILGDGPLAGVSIGAPISATSDDLKLYRRSQDMSFWYQS